jgi:glycosyltransferase involved in cell wall biosynthesis
LAIVNPLISIVTPSLNQASFIEGTIQSVLQQKGMLVEYIVVDGGSHDRTLEILKNYESELKWISEPDRGQADAINKGFRLARGAILGWLNADDLYCPGVLSKAVKQFQEDPDLMMVYGDAHHVDAEGGFLDQYPSDEFRLESLAFHCFICQPACFFRRSLLEAIGYLDIRLNYAMDLDFWIRLGRLQVRNPSWKFRYVRELFALTRMHRDNKTLSKRQESLREIIGVVRRYFGHVPYNWVYRLVESAGGTYDGYFRRSPLRFSLFLKSVIKWIWFNRNEPGFILHFLKHCLLSPRTSLQRLSRQAGGRML